MNSEGMKYIVAEPTYVSSLEDLPVGGENCLRALHEVGAIADVEMALQNQLIGRFFAEPQ